MDFNHISKKLSETQLSELKNLYRTYHKQYWCYKQMFKNFKRYDLALKLSSVILTTTGTIVGAVTLNPIFLTVVTGSGVLLQTVTNHKNFSKRTEACRYAFQSYQKLLNKLKYILRSGDFDDFLEKELSFIDDEIADLCPAISNHYEKLYQKKFHSK